MFEIFPFGLDLAPYLGNPKRVAGRFSKPVL